MLVCTGCEGTIIAVEGIQSHWILKEQLGKTDARRKRQEGYQQEGRSDVHDLMAAETLVYLAAAPQLRAVIGEFFYKCGRGALAAEAQDDAIAQKLWLESERIAAAVARGLMTGNG